MENIIEKEAMFKISYGLFVLTARDGEKDNGCIVNTVSMITEKPLRITVYVNKLNYTEQMIKKTGVFNVSVLTESTPFEVFKRFGFAGTRINLRGQRSREAPTVCVTFRLTLTR